MKSSHRLCIVCIFFALFRTLRISALAVALRNYFKKSLTISLIIRAFNTGLQNYTWPYRIYTARWTFRANSIYRFLQIFRHPDKNLCSHSLSWQLKRSDGFRRKLIAQLRFEDRNDFLFFLKFVHRLKEINDPLRSSLRSNCNFRQKKNQIFNIFEISRIKKKISSRSRVRQVGKELSTCISRHTTYNHRHFETLNILIKENDRKRKNYI